MYIIYIHIYTYINMYIYIYISVCTCVYVCVCVYVYVCVCVCCVSSRPSTVRASSVWGWKSRGQINDVALETLPSSTKSVHRYFSMKYRAFLASSFILFTLEAGKATT